jgi:hypothetical protein
MAASPETVPRTRAHHKTTKRTQFCPPLELPAPANGGNFAKQKKKVENHRHIVTPARIPRDVLHFLVN